jgi:ABC-type branched-subunit amino acid transport system permease subunit
MLSAFLALSGYIRFRADRGTSIAGLSSLILALAILGAALSGLPASRTAGVVLFIIVLALGGLGIRHIFKKAGSRARGNESK